MNQSKKLSWAKCVVIAFALPIAIYAYATGPDPGYSGVPSEGGSCSSCHSGSGGSGSVSVAFPNGLVYTPGVTQHLIVTVADSAQRRWGFQLAARQASNSRSQAGTFSPSDGNSQLVCVTTSFRQSSCSASGALQYIEHTLAGTRSGQKNSAAFAFDWNPPATDVGDVVVYVAGNAANADGTQFGDHIYANKYTLHSQAPAPSNLPTITSVVNGASFQPGIAPGSWVTIQGTNLASSSRTWRNDEIVNGVLPTRLDDVSVSIDGNPAAVFYISPTQINVQAPDDANQGPVQVKVTTAAGASSAFTAMLQPASPACFLWSGRYAVATRQDYSLVGPTSLFANATTPAKPGEVVILWGTGFGPTTPATPADEIVAGAAYDAQAPVVTIGGIQAQVIGAALSPGFAGLYQIAVVIPPTAPSGDLPIMAALNGVQSPGNVYITVQ